MNTKQEWKFTYANREVTSISVIQHPDKVTATDMINDALRRHRCKDFGEGVFRIDDEGAFASFD